MPGLSPETGWPEKYFFLRTNLSVAYSEDALDAFSGSFRWPGWRLLLNGKTWSNGVVLKIQCPFNPDYFPQNRASAIEKFDNWLIHDGRKKYAEKNHDLSLMKNAFERGRISQLFMRFNDDGSGEEITELIRSSLKDSTPVFHFDNGKILFVYGKDPASVVIRRCKKHLKRLYGWALIDFDGHTHTQKGWDESIWNPFDLDIPKSLRFE